MKLNTRRYVATHGRQPKGMGRWGFELTFGTGRGSYYTECIWENGTLSTAKAAAIRDLKTLHYGDVKDVVEIVVLP